MLTTAAFRIPGSLFCNLIAYRLPPEFSTALGELRQLWRKKTTTLHANLPSASLSAALQAVTGQPVRILPHGKPGESDLFLLTTRPVNLGLLQIAVSTWEKLARGGSPDQDANVLSPMLAGLTEDRIRVEDAILKPSTGRIQADDWVFKVLHWLVSERLAAEPIDFDGLPVPFRLDTEGHLVAWAAPITKKLRKGGQARALMKIAPRIATIPGMADLVCVLDVSLTRLESSFFNVKRVWIDHRRSHGGSALLRLPVARATDQDEAGGWKSVPRDYSLAIVRACGLDPIPWHQDILTAEPDRIRGGRASNDEHPIGTGVGPRTFLRIAEHAQKILEIEPLQYRETKIRVLNNNNIRTDPIAPTDLDTAVAAAGYEKLRLVHLSGKSDARERVRKALMKYKSNELPELGPQLAQVQPLTKTAEFVVYDVASLLEHGCSDRRILRDQAPLLQAPDDVLVLAFVETEYAQGMKIPEDAKPELRRALAEMKVASQFLATPPPGHESITSARPRRTPRRSIKQEEAEETDYPAESSMKDILMRASGMLDDRLRAAVNIGHSAPLDRDAWLVGVHVRRQQTPCGRGRKKHPERRLVCTMVAIHAHVNANRPWTARFYIPGSGWLHHPRGIALFHSGQIGVKITGNEKAAYANLRVLVDQALAELRDVGPHPVITMLDAEATRSVWSGVSDVQLRDGLLPGDTLADKDQIPVVRVNAERDKLPRPTHRTTGQQSRDPRQPATPGNQVFDLIGDDGTRSCLLGRASRTFQAGIEGRIGALYTRFTLPENQERMQAKPWHAFNATEFVVVRQGPFAEEDLLALTARLSAQPLSWDSRTAWPTPLHMARKADDDHPYCKKDDPDRDDDED